MGQRTRESLERDGVGREAREILERNNMEGNDMKTSEKGIEFIIAHEGLRLQSYPDPATGGEPWTIGVGLTSAAGIIDVKPGMKITLQQAHDYLVASLHQYEKAVNEAVTVPLEQNEFDALVSLCFNIGAANLKHSTVVKKLNAGDREGAAHAFLMWDKANHHVLAGLHRRREDESHLFLMA